MSKTTDCKLCRRDVELEVAHYEEGVPAAYALPDGWEYAEEDPDEADFESVYCPECLERAQENLASILRAGFDESWVSYEDRLAVRVRCSQCQAAVINGVACHEHGCPNKASWGQPDQDDEYQEEED